MSQLLSRTPFLEETSILFSNEKTVIARNKIVECVNDLANATTAGSKVELLAKIQELVLHSDIELLEEFAENVLSFAYDPNQDVRKATAGFIEEVCKIKIQFLPKVINALVTLLRDQSALVTKRVIQGCASIYKNTLQWICTTADITDDLETAWNTLCMIKVNILDMIDHDNDGIRTNAIKFLEGVVLLQTYPDEDSMKRENDFSLEGVPLTIKIVRPRKLEEEAIKIMDILLKFQVASHISSVNLIACTGTLCLIAKMRPSLMNPVIENLKYLHSNLPPTLTNSQVSSVRKTLKMQFLNILKHPASFEHHATITEILVDLGASNSEINKAIPKIDKKEQVRRAKRAADNFTHPFFIKKQKVEDEKTGKSKERPVAIPVSDTPRQMEIDVDEIKEQQTRSNTINEKFIFENLKNHDVVSQIVMNTMSSLPDECPESFLKNYTPVVNLTILQQIQKIAKQLAVQMTEKKLGPGAKEITAEPPMRPKISAEEEKSIIFSVKKDVPEEVMEVDDEVGDIKKDDTARKLRETLERVKGEQAMPKLKQRLKTLKLEEITKPLHKDLKTQFLLDAVRRILKAERPAIMGGCAFKRKKIIVVLASTFMPNVRQIILEYLFEDISRRFDLAFMWLFEEYSLLQGFTRHSYVKSEHKHDHAYNLLLTDVIKHVLEKEDLREKESLLKRLYLEAPLITEDAFKLLFEMCENEGMAECGLILVKDLLIRRPPKQQKLLGILLKYSVHLSATLRDKALENLLTIYSLHKMMVDKIEEFAVKWLHYLEKEVPSSEFIKQISSDEVDCSAWTEDLAKPCLHLFLTILPLKENLIHTLCKVYIVATSDIKRIFLRAIESPIRKLGQQSKELLHVIETCAGGSDASRPLIMKIIGIVTEKSTPSQELIEKVRILHQSKSDDVRVLIPIINSLSKKEILGALPKILKLSPNIVKDVLLRLMGVGLDAKLVANLPVSATELLVNLHTLDNVVEMKFIIKAITVCLAEKETYTYEVLGIVLQQLVEMNPLPKLLMRTILQSLVAHPRLSGFVTSLLHRLIVKQVWKQKLIWDGFLKCCQKLQPQSMGVLIQLPVTQLQDALNIAPELRVPLLEYAKEIREQHLGHVSQQVMELLVGKDQAHLYDPGMHPDVVILNPDAIQNVHFEPISIKQEPMDTDSSRPAGEKGNEPSVPGLD